MNVIVLHKLLLKLAIKKNFHYSQKNNIFFTKKPHLLSFFSKKYAKCIVINKFISFHIR